MNISIPPAMERFVRSQVESGRYSSASEVVRDGLRLLEEARHRRLLEKWIYEDLTPEELAELPDELKERAKSHFQKMVADAREQIAAGRVVDGPEAMKRLRAELEALR